MGHDENLIAGRERVRSACLSRFAVADDEADPGALADRQITDPAASAREPAATMKPEAAWVTA
jgi:hypothetical protein